jgi:hypothetical protein
MAWLDSQVQFKLTIDPVDPFVVPFEALHVAQVQETQLEIAAAVIIRKP